MQANTRPQQGSTKEQLNSQLLPFNSCQYDPLWDLEDQTEVIDVLLPRELHLLLGIVNKLLNHH